MIYPPSSVQNSETHKTSGQGTTHTHRHSYILYMSFACKADWKENCCSLYASFSPRVALRPQGQDRCYATCITQPNLPQYSTKAIQSTIFEPYLPGIVQVFLISLYSNAGLFIFHDYEAFDTSRPSWSSTLANQYHTNKMKKTLTANYENRIAM